MNRREWLTKVGLFTTALALWPKMAYAKTVKIFKPKMTIASILAASYPTVLAEQLDGHNWISPKLRQMEKEGRITVQALGACIIVPQDPPPHKHYEVSEHVIPILWAQSDEDKSPTEESKINLVRALLVNAFEFNDELLLEKIGRGRLVASKEYRYKLGSIMEYKEKGYFAAKLYTAGAFIDGPEFIRPTTSQFLLDKSNGDRLV